MMIDWKFCPLIGSLFVCFQRWNLALLLWSAWRAIKPFYCPLSYRKKKGKFVLLSKNYRISKLSRMKVRKKEFTTKIAFWTKILLASRVVLQVNYFWHYPCRPLYHSHQSFKRREFAELLSSKKNFSFITHIKS